MAMTVNLKPLLHRKSWENCCPLIAPNVTVNTTAGGFVCADKFNIVPGAKATYVASAAAIYEYDGEQDAWLQLPASGVAGTFGAGSCGEFRGLGAMGGVFTQTATAGGAQSITTNRTIVKSLAGMRIRAVAGTGVGTDTTIVSNTNGANSVITTAAGTFDATTQFQIFSGSIWFFNAGAGAVGFTVYDRATNAWTARSVTGLPTTWGTEGRLVSTIGSIASFATGTASAGASTTLTNGAKAWGVNMWVNNQVRITAGTGIGQIRKITSNTSTVLTVSAAWTINPDATSQYSIEGDEDAFYLMGNNAVTTYKFLASANAWTTLAPVAARAGAAAAGFSANWIDSVTGWSNETLVTLGTGFYKQNGRYIVSFRGGAGNLLDFYDIAGNTWISGISYGAQTETFTTGSCSFDFAGIIYIQKEITGRILKFDLDKFSLEPFTTTPFTQGATAVGDKMFMLPYTNGGTTVKFIYTLGHTRPEFSRMIVI